ncbi:hypothetical protein B0H13DRAFT_2383924 [Mycena leptocephala]|nr:hypothetical protein B0H13DRAFT_2383924 [Mycena leptocephala]
MPSRKRKPKDDDCYEPSHDQPDKGKRSAKDDTAKKQRDRQSWVKYYAAHPEIREKRRIEMARKRAAIKAKRRVRDPPKKKKPSITPEPCNPSERDPTDEVVSQANDSQHPTADSDVPMQMAGSACSHSSAERLATTPQALDPPEARDLTDEVVSQAATRKESQHTTPISDVPMQTAASACSRTSAERLATLVLTEMAMGREAVDDALASAHQRLIGLEVGPSAVPASTQDLMTLPGAVGPFTWAETARMLVAELNAVPLTGPTPAEAWRWGLPRRAWDWAPSPLLSAARWVHIATWTARVGVETTSDGNAWDRGTQLIWNRAINSDLSLPVTRMYDCHGRPCASYWRRCAPDIR